LIEVEQGHAERLRAAIEDSARGGDVFKCAIAAGVKEAARIAAIRFGRAITLVRAIKAAEDVGFLGPAHIIAGKEVEKSIAVIVKPQRRSAKSLPTEEAARASHIDEGAFSGVVEEAALSHASDEDIWKTIVVVIADGHAHAIHLKIESGAFGYVG